MYNPNCDGSGPHDGGEVRVLPSGGSSNLILCSKCFDHEIAWRKERNTELEKQNQFDLPTWWQCKRYDTR